METELRAGLGKNPLACDRQGCNRAKHLENKFCKSHVAGMRRKLREQVLRDCGMVKVRGALGSVYWE